MLTLILIEEEAFDETTEEFVVKELKLEFEHSLVSLSKWESIYQRPFLGNEKKTAEEIEGYVRAMLLTEDAPENFLHFMTKEDLIKINEYISSPQSATTFSDLRPAKVKARPEIITSELIYYWMSAFAIPAEYQYWHLNRLFALLQIANIKQSKPEKMSQSELAARNRNLNEQRRKALGTSG